MTNYQRTANWLQACGKEPGNPQHLSVQIGCWLEETVELLDTMRTNTEGGELVRARTVQDVRWLAGKLKSGDYIAHIAPHRRTEALDGMCDIEVTVNGVAHLAGMDKDRADALVLDSNDDKLIDGKPVLLPGGKIGKREGWQGPDLKECA